MLYRKATLEDLEALTLLFEAYRAFYEMAPDLSAAGQFLSERIKNEESVILLAVTEAGALAGFTQLYPLFSSTRMKRLWLLNDLYVDPRYRGTGTGEGLIEAAKELSRNTHAAGLLLETAKSNTIGNRLYPKCGFTLDTDHNYYSWTA